MQKDSTTAKQGAVMIETRPAHGVTQYVVHAQARFLVDGAESPEQALDWLNDTSLDLRVTSLGHWQRVVLVDDEAKLVAMQRPGEDAFRAALGDLPLMAQWAPPAWPARACTPRLLQPTKGQQRD